MKKWTFIFCALIVLDNVCAHKILVAFPYPGKSHTILGEGYVRHLLKAGHEVTYLTPVLLKPHPNLTQVDVSSNIDGFELDKVLNIEMVINKQVDLQDMHIMYETMLTVATTALKHENIQNFLMSSNEKFDLVVAEWLFHELYSGFAPIFNCPYVWSSSIETHPMILKLIDDFGHPAYFPDLISMVSLPLTFPQRVHELWNLFDLYYIRWSLKEEEERAFKEIFGPAAAKRGIQLPTLEEVKYNASMVLGNSHVSSGEAHRLPINYIPIAGYHIPDEIPPLPKDLQKILDEAPHGVIYFSLGSMMKGKTMPMEMKKGFLKVFSELKQTVLWKLEEQLPDLPANVRILQWAPQQSILAHPNCKLFITHGGLLSTSETLHFGVPVIGIPLFSDQFVNVMRAVRKGFGLQVELGYNTPSKLKGAIEEILGNPKYTKRVKELSFIYHHRPVKPGAELVHWIEHVIETNGAPHLRSPALHVPMYQKLYLDLLGLILLVIFVLVRIARKLLSAGKKEKKEKNN